MIAKNFLDIQPGTSQPVRVMNDEYPQHTPELAALFQDMMTKAEALQKVARKLGGIKAIRSPEYATHHKAWRAYWNAVDADRANVKV